MANLTRRSNRMGSAVPLIAAAGMLAGVGAALAWKVYSRRRIPHELPLTTALDAELTYVNTPSAGRIGYYSAGPQVRGRAPLLLVHSVNAAASAFEMKPLFDRLSQNRRVYALDLPGFGFSNRSDREYTPDLMRNALLDFMRLVLKSAPTDVVALSLGCEFVALAATQRPEAFRTLTLISPTGMSERSRRVRSNNGLLRALRARPWGRPLFDLLTSRPSLRLFTGQSARRSMPSEFINYAYATSHQPDAELAPFAFVAGKLFTPTVFDAYAALRQPTLLIYGNDPFAQYDFVDQLLERDNWRIIPLPRAGALAHWDFPELVTMKIEDHIAE